MHLCVDARMYCASGIGTYLQNLLLPLSQSFDLTLIGDPGEIAATELPRIPTDIPIYSVAELLRFPSLIPSCDIFWSPHYNVPVLPIRAKKRLVTIHDVFHLAYVHTLSLKQKLYAKLIMQAAIRLSDGIITVSEFSKSEIQAYTGASASKISVIPNGVNHQQFHTDYTLAETEQVSEKYYLPAKYILYVGNVKPHKNLSRLVEAYALIAEHLPHKLVIVGKKEGFITGDTSLHDRIQQNSVLQDKIIFTGFVADEDLPKIYAMASLFVFPSLYEGFGLPPLEAMASGCLTLTSQRASMPEICGDATTYFHPEDTPDLAAKIKGLLTIPTHTRQEIITAGVKKAVEYTWKAAAQQHVEVMKQLCLSN